jgi:4-aminobutyrate aminotransferase
MSSTTGGNPLASAASIAVLDVMKEEKLPENALKVGEYLFKRFKEIQTKHPTLGDIRGKGLVIGLEIVQDKELKTPAPELTKKIIFKCGQYGMLLGKVGLHGNVIRIAPPLIITEEEAEIGVAIIDKVLGEVESGG